MSGSDEALTTETRHTSGRPLPGGLARGDLVGRYVVLDHVGEGGMGVVYAAYDPELDRRVALKIVAAGHGEGRAGLLREAQALARVSHPNVLPVFDAGVWGDTVFIAMELLEGMTLARWLEERKPGWREALRVCGQAGRGLAAAHAAGVVHRDFTPRNVLVGANGRVQVIDFGIARLAAAGQAAAARAPGDSAGTPPYMSAEQIAGRPPDPKSDQFSFCVVLHEAVFGARPFAGRDRERMVAPPEDVRVPRWLRRAILRGLRRDPEARYPSMTALLDDVGREPFARGGLALAAVGVAGALALGAVVVSGSSAPRDPCAGAARRAGAIFGGPRRAEVRRRLAAAGADWGGAVADAATRALDAQVGRWSAERTAACEATTVRHEQSPALQDLRVACLDRQLDEIDALVGVLADADAAVAERAVAAVQALPPAADCADARALLGVAPRPDDPRAAEVERGLARATPLLDAGRFADAQAAALPLAQAARALGYRPLEAEALFLLGRARANLSTSGVEELRDGLNAAVAGRADALAARIATSLVFQVGIELQRHDEGAFYAAQALALVERAGNDPVALAHVRTKLGSLLRREGKLDDALQTLEQARLELELRRPGSLELADLLRDLGSVEMERGRHALALSWFQRSLAMFESILGPDHPQLGGVLVNTGSALTLLGRHAEALAAFERAQRILGAKLGPRHPNVARLLNNMGLLETKQGHPERALALHRQALEIFEATYGPDHVNLVPTLINMAVAARALGRHDDALALDRRTLELVEKGLGRDHLDAAHPLTGMGQSYLALGKPALALPLLERALALRSAAAADVEDRAETQFALARARWAVGARPAARALAAEARAGYAAAAAANPLLQREVDEIDAWLREQTLTP